MKEGEGKKERKEGGIDIIKGIGISMNWIIPFQRRKGKKEWCKKSCIAIFCPPYYHQLQILQNKLKNL